MYVGRSGPEFETEVGQGTVTALSVADAKVRWQVALGVSRFQTDEDPPFVLQPEVSALVADGATLYVGGTFTTIAGGDRMHAAALDSASGKVLPWHPRFTGVDQRVGSIAVSSGAVTLGGFFQVALPDWQIDLAQFARR